MAASEYCTTTNVQEEFKDITWGTGNSILAARVTRFIQEASAHIEGKIGLVYQTPVDATASPKATLLLKAICIALVVKRLDPILNVKAPQTKDSQQSGGKKERTPDDDLDDIVAGKISLIDVSKISSTDGVKSFAVTDGIEHVFTRDTKQW